MFFFFKQKTAYEMRISDWSSDVCSSDLGSHPHRWQLETDRGWNEEGGGNGLEFSVAQHQHCFVAHGAATQAAQGVEREHEALRFDTRPEERSVGKECVSTCRSPCSPSN